MRTKKYWRRGTDPKSQHGTRSQAERGFPLVGERGLSLVEVIVATMIMGIGIAGAASVLATSSRTVAAADHRSQASSLATSEMESIRAMPYSLVRIDPTAVGYQASYGGRPTVTIATAATDGPGLDTGDPDIDTLYDDIPVPDNLSFTVIPTSTIEVAGSDYTVIRHVTWAPVGSGASLDQFGYKVVNIIVRWTDSAGQHEIQQESGLFLGIGS